jgi:S1-C subfamily serine protease
MADQSRFCTQNFKVWVAFLMGMVIIVIAIVVFDKVLGVGSVSATPVTARPETVSDAETLGKPATYLALTGGDTASAWLGIEAVDLPEVAASKLGLDIKGGVLVSRVLPGSPAANDGLLRGDIIFELDRRKVTGVADLVRLLGKLDPGDRVRVVLLRDGSREVFYVKLGEIPAASPSTIHTVAGEISPGDLKWGIAVSELTGDLRVAYDIPKREKGVVIVMVVPGSAAQRAGLRNGDLIKQVDRETVESLSDFFSSLTTSSRHVLLKVYRGGADIFVHVIAVSPMMPVGGGSDSEDDEEEEIKGYKGVPEPLPPMGKPGSTSSLTPDPAAAPTQTALGVTTSTDKDRDEDQPICKRVQDLERAL